MMLSVELKKNKRSGLIWSFLGGAILAGLIPVLNMAFRSEVYTGTEGDPLQILLNANWQMMAMLNTLLIVVSACLSYYVESADNALQKMLALPIKEESMFFAKFLLLSMFFIGVFVIEVAALAFSSVYWFSGYPDLTMEIFKNLGYIFLLSLPALVLSLMIASFFTNIWIALGIGIIGIFLATMLSDQSVILTAFPFNLPFQTLHGTDSGAADTLMWIAIGETVVLLLIQKIMMYGRRLFR